MGEKKRQNQKYETLLNVAHANETERDSMAGAAVASSVGGNINNNNNKRAFPVLYSFSQTRDIL